MKNINKWIPSKYVIHKGKLIASRDANEVQPSSRLMVDIIANYYDSYVKKYCHGKLIDLGCGKVPLYQIYKNYVTSNTCVDWKNTTHKNAFLDFECDLTQKLPFDKEQFNTIILSDVLEHIPNPIDLINEMYRILDKNGYVLMNVPFFYWLHEVPHDYYRYTEYALLHLVKKAGFKVEMLEAIGGFPEVVADIIAKNISRLPYIGKILSIIIQKATLYFVQRTITGRNISLQTRKHFPLCYFMVLKKAS